MEPNELLRQIMSAIRDKRWEDAFLGMAMMFDMVRNGHLPNVPEKTYIALGDGGPVSFSLLSYPNTKILPGSGATFIRYEFSSVTGQMEESHKYECPGVE
jgi:hypothetical protein